MDYDTTQTSGYFLKLSLELGVRDRKSTDYAESILGDLLPGEPSDVTMIGSFGYYLCCLLGSYMGVGLYISLFTEEFDTKPAFYISVFVVSLIIHHFLIKFKVSQIEFFREKRRLALSRKELARRVLSLPVESKTFFEEIAETSSIGPLFTPEEVSKFQDKQPSQLPNK